MKNSKSKQKNKIFAILDNYMCLKGNDEKWGTKVDGEKMWFKIQNDPIEIDYPKTSLLSIYQYELFIKIFGIFFYGSTKKDLKDAFTTYKGANNKTCTVTIGDLLKILEIDYQEIMSEYSPPFLEQLKIKAYSEVKGALINVIYEYVNYLLAEYQIRDINVLARIRSHIFNLDKDKTYELFCDEVKKYEYIHLKDVIYVLYQKYKNITY